MVKTGIKEVISKHPANIVKAFLGKIIGVIYKNVDLELALGDWELRQMIEEEAGKKLNFDVQEMFDADTLSLYQRMKVYVEEDRKLPKKKEAIELIEEVFENDVMFEIIALIDTELDGEAFMDNLGCAEKYRELCLDRAFCARRDYLLGIREYYEAAANLYGVIHMQEFAELVEEYEKKEWGRKQFQKESGTYAKSVLFTPDYFSSFVLGMTVESCLTYVPISVDGFLLHYSFTNQCEKEGRLLAEYLEKRNIEEEMDLEKALDDFARKEGDAEFRKLYRLTEEKPRYLPGREQFLKYADEDYMEPLPAVRNFKIFLKKTYKEDLDRLSLEMEEDEDIDSFLEDIIADIRITMDGNVAGKCLSTNTDFVQDVFEELGCFSIDSENLDELKEILSYIMEIKNSERIWSDKGYSPNEMRRILPWERGTTDAYESSVQMQRKVYPNDPCPCGSGRKFKKCCGKN